MKLLSRAANSPLIRIVDSGQDEMKNQLCAEAYLGNLNVFLQRVSHLCKDRASS